MSGLQNLLKKIGDAMLEALQSSVTYRDIFMGATLIAVYVGLQIGLAVFVHYVPLRVHHTGCCVEAKP